VLLALAAAACAARVQAAGIELPSPGSEAWQPLRLRGIERQTSYGTDPGSKGQPGTVWAVSNCSASGLVLPLDDSAIDLAETPWLHWRWRVDRGLDVSDEQTRGGDDFAARVYVMFQLDRTPSIFARLRHRLFRSLYGDHTPGSALTFVWSSHVVPGATWDNPYAASAKMIALTRGPNAHWRSESVDVPTRYRELFGADLPPLMGIAIMSDSDDSCQNAEAGFGSFAFRSTAKAPFDDGAFDGD
jgi:hypothetical protein